MKSASVIGIFSIGAWVIFGCSGSGSSSTTNPTDPPTGSGNGSGAPAASSGSSSSSSSGGSDTSSPTQGACPKLTATYEESRKPAGNAHDDCAPGTYIAPVNFSDPPALNPSPGCTTLNDEWSADQCTHTVVTKCVGAGNDNATCTEVTTFEHDDKGYSGTSTCSGTHDTVDDDNVPFTCTTTIAGTKK